ncbi:hypothetical protein BN1723_004128 [Verticillium longisporum]|uniref:Peptidase M14 domain-containing protein n=1 Tax=Verticillium longisporum TaxID=100787 RepID=A0A0G4MMB8_VERLO|nr:hypothetical protein BN1723_004128 [Verticillium longisporum]
MKASVLSALALLPLAFGAALPKPKKVDYTGFKGIRVNLPEDDQEARHQISKLAASVLNPGSHEALDIVVSPENVDAVSRLATNTTILVEDIGAAFAEEDTASLYAVPSETWFTTYHSYADHLTFLNDLQSSFPTQSEIFTTGSSFQGRALTGIHIWGSGGKGSKPAVIFHGTVHAREWISTMTTEYMAYQLLTKYATDTGVKAAVDKFDYYIIPVLNPDGFVYTQTTNRLWRKNRQTLSGSSCVGRDPNRNWPYKWEGRAAADAPEIRGAKAQVDTLAAGRGIRFYIDFHSYGQYILWPFGYSCSVFERGCGVVALLPEVRALLANEFPDRHVAVVAAGGIVEASGVAAAVALGAEGVVMGTRFIATPEAGFADEYKALVVKTTDGGVSTWKTPFHDRLAANGLWKPGFDGRAIVGDIHREHMKGGVTVEESRERLKTGWSEEEAKFMVGKWAGTGVGLVKDLKPASEVVTEAREGARRIIRELAEGL